jgi:ATP-dependent 26S proteasome regulatory subunit
MPHPHLCWQPGAEDSVAVSNARVCLALMRVYRYVSLPFEDADLPGVARCLWPIVRQFPVLLRGALRHAEEVGGGLRTKRRRRFADEASEDQLKKWCELLSNSPRHVPTEPQDDWILDFLGEAMAYHRPHCTKLFDAMEVKLEELAREGSLASDSQVNLLANLLQLSTVETAFLRLCVAAASSSIGSSFFRVAQAPVRLVHGVQRAIGAHDEHEVRSMLRRTSRLVRSGLVENDAFSGRGDMEDVLRLTRQCLLILGSGANDIDGMAAVVLRKSEDVTDEDLQWPHLEERTELLRELIAHGVRDGAKGVNVLLYGAPGTGKTQFAMRLLKQVGAEPFSVADTDEHGDPATRAERLSSLMLTELFAPAGRSVVVLDEAEDIFQTEYNDPMARAFGKREDAKSWMNHLLEQNPRPVIWISNRIDHIDPAYLRRFTYCLEFGSTPRAVRRTIASRHLDPLGCSPSIVEEVSAASDVSPALVSSAARFVRIAHVGTERADPAVRMMLGDMVKALGSSMGPRLPERSTRFDLQYFNARGSVGPDLILAGLARCGRGRVVLSGPPGTGKTQLASEIAHRLGRELIYKTASDINSMWFGQSERNVARMFQDCDPAREVLFLDEADTLMGSRDATAHRAEVAVTAEFLRQVEAFSGIFVCATNFQNNLDPALLRRFEFRLEMLALSPGQRLALFCETALGWKREAGELQPSVAPHLQRRLTALDLLTPGDFANVVRRLRTLDLQINPEQWLQELESEHRAKPGGARTTVGFL